MAQRLRIYQIDENGPLRPLIFRNYVDFQKAGYQKLPRNGYKLVYDGELGSSNLESIFATFNCNLPEGYIGRSMAASDVIGICGENTDQYFFCDMIGFTKIDF